MKNRNNPHAKTRRGWPGTIETQARVARSGRRPARKRPRADEQVDLIANLAEALRVQTGVVVLAGEPDGDLRVVGQVGELSPDMAALVAALKLRLERRR